MGFLKKTKTKQLARPGETHLDASRPELASRHKNRKSTIKLGRTIGEQREKLETANERAAARKKDKRKNRARIIIVTSIFLCIIAVLVCLYFVFVKKDESSIVVGPTTTASYEPTIEIVDEDAQATGGKITGRMREYIGQAEADFKELGYHPVKAVLPSGTVREVDFYLQDYPGFVKTAIDRGSAVSIEDADRMLRYLKEKGITDFKYIDVRISGKAFWQ